MKTNQERSRQRHNFLLTFFDEPHQYSYKEVNGFMLVRQWNGTSKVWQVAIWNKDSWKLKQEYSAQQMSWV